MFRPRSGTPDSASGNFQTIIHWGNGGSSPYVQYDNWLDYTQSAAIGSSANSDYGRYNSPAAQAALTKLATTNPSNKAGLLSATQALENLVSSQVPVAPLLYGAGLGRVLHGALHGFCHREERLR